jgi:eukaryotic-like serine/threonine-protein kinase
MRSTSSSARIDGSEQAPAQQTRVINERYELVQAVESDALRARYLATDRSLERTVMVELFTPNVDDAELLESRVLRRLGRVAQLRAPGIPRLLDGGVDEASGPFIVHEPVPSGSLRAARRGLQRLGVTRTLACIVRIGRALQAAHDRGVVHGRICPENIHASPLGDQIWLLGWLDGAVPRARTRGLTDLGSSPYFAPEWFRDELIGPGADVYALGVLMHEMLTGQDASVGPIRARHPSIPARLQPIVERALEPDPRRRWSSVGPLVAALEDATPVASPRAAVAEPVVPAPEPNHPRRWSVGALASVLALCATLSVFVLAVFGFARVFDAAPSIVKGATLNVPSLPGKSVDEARKIASEQGLDILVIGERPSDRYPVGQVMQQSPVPGWRPYEKQPIRVTLSNGVLVPNLVGLSITEAAKQANQRGWKIARVETGPSDGAEHASVMIQSPPPDNLVDAPGEIAVVVAD